MYEHVAELEYEVVLPGWLLRPVFSTHRDRPDELPKVTVQLFHSACQKRAQGPEYCGLVNRDALKLGDTPKYKCNACAALAPESVVSEKLLAADRYKGYDPRNNRRAAVLATKNKGTKNVR